LLEGGASLCALFIAAIDISEDFNERSATSRKLRNRLLPLDISINEGKLGHRAP
jgi:hypothetical protein